MIKNYFLIFFTLIVALSFTACVNNDYDLTNGVNTEMTLGGDSLSFPLGKMKAITLGSMIDSLGGDFLNKTSGGDYTIVLDDSTRVELDAISPVSFTIAPFTIPPVNATFADIKFPKFNLPEIVRDSVVELPAVSINTGDLDLPAIDEVFAENISFGALPPPAGVKRVRNENIIINANPISGSSEFTPVFNLDFKDMPIEYVSAVMLKQSVVTIEFDKSELKTLGLISVKDKINSLKLQFPKEYQLSSPNGGTIDKATNSFVVKDAEGAADKNFTASLVISSLDFTAETLKEEQIKSGKLHFAQPITIAYEYLVSGEVDPVTAAKLAGSNAKIKLKVNAKPQLDDIKLTTTNLAFEQNIANKSSYRHILEGLPADLSEVNHVDFEQGATLHLKFFEPNLSPFMLTEGNCVIQLPKIFEFRPKEGLNTTTNTYSIPFASLFDSHKLPVAGLKINKKVLNQQIIFDESFSYNLQNLKIAGSTTLSQINAMNETTNLKIAISASDMVVKDATFKTGQMSIAVPSQETDIDINEFVANEVRKIYQVGLHVPAKIELKIDVDNLPQSVDSIFFKNYTIKLPQPLVFAAGDVNSKNEIILNRGFAVKKGFAKSVTLTAFDFGAEGIELNNGRFVFKNKISMAGEIFVKSTSLSIAEVDKVVIRPSLTIEPIQIGTVTGKINPEIDPVNETLKIDFPESLRNENNYLDFNNPYILLNVGNTMGVPLSVNLKLVAKKGGMPLPNATINTQLAIQGAKTPGAYTHSKYWITNSVSKYKPDESYQAVIIPQLPDLLKNLPDEIAIEVIPTVKDTIHRVDLYSPVNAIKINYAIKLPLDFGEDFKIQYADTLANVADSFGKFLKYAKEIDIEAVVKNGIPLDLNLKLLPLDSENKQIPDSEIAMKQNFVIRSCNSTGEASTTLASFGIKENKPGSFARITAFKYVVSANRGGSLIPLNSNQTLEIELRVKIPKGLTIDPSKK